MEQGVRGLTQKIASGDKAFAEYGLSLEHLQRLNPQEQLYAVADALSGIANPTDRAAAAMRLMGESGTQLLPLLNGGAKGMREMQAEAQRLGLVMTTAESKSAAAFTDALGTLWSQLKMVSAQIGASVAPLLTDLLKRSQPIIASTIEWIRANRPLLANLFAIAAAVAAAGGAIIGLGVGMKATAVAIGPLISGARVFAGGLNLAIKGAVGLSKILGSAVLPILKAIGGTLIGLGKAALAVLTQGFAAGVSAAGSALGALLTPIGLVGAAIVGLGAYVVYASGVFGDLLEAGQTVWNGLKTTALAAWGAIGDALANGNIAAAAKVAWTGLQLEWTRGMNEFKNVWTTFSTFVKQVFLSAVFDLAKKLNTAWESLETGWIHVCDFFADAWTAMMGGLLKGWRWFERVASKGAIDIMAKLGHMTETAADAAKFGIDQTINAALEQDKTDQNKVVSDRDTQRKNDLDKIGQRRQSIDDELKAQLQKALDSLDAAAKADISERAEKLKQAQAEFDAAVAAAKAAGETLTAPDLQDRVMEGALAAKSQAATGTFSGFADRMFDFGQADNPQKKIEANTADAAKSLGKIVRQGVRAVIAYGA
ncbi:MAG: hypothetical protein ACK5Q5_19000 [Planctomycetaceae bacterium]